MEIIQSLTLTEVASLLQISGLDASDISEEMLTHFYGVKENEELIAVVGLEMAMPFALVRSLAVSERLRNTYLASRLLEKVEQIAVELGVEALYLLTNTASQYFIHKGYELAERSDAPIGIQQTMQFRQLCPASAGLLKKVLS
ncbi:GNAT family N-acetyltransferase [Leeia sp. TBRC 13508]|uniref:GNAT family N-acetyltransferase n=1 Tax=Leeia speluncae TaxID=2884804 RepID=A0ABS8D8L4_9NEIS|nr:GNAT family N-acetyltransferase [Leeia speluncae]MCB6184539.1 GNAT family N-acetyltransferase [Leeia speluncae]